MTRYLLVIALYVCFTANVFSQTEKYSRVKVNLTSVAALKKLSRLGIETDHGKIEKNSFSTDLSATEISIIKSNGFTYEIIIDDVIKHYQEQNKNTNPTQRTSSANQYPCKTVSTNHYVTPTHFTYGTMAGYFTYPEMLAQLDSMANAYPNLVKSKQAIDTFTTIEHRPIYWLKISDNPNINESEPEALYTAVHHAREPAGMSQLITYMWYLLENYDTDPQIKALVDNSELYFVPCLNPDGYIYNYTTNPNGGGMWRKNRRAHFNGDYGTDLNRNYGYDFAKDDVGSSPNTFSETFRGDSAFSEPETQAIKWFCEQHQFKLALNYHTYGNLLINSMDAITNPQQLDTDIYNTYSTLMTQLNQYNYGNSLETVGYSVNGDADAWMHGEETSKNKIYTMTPEAGKHDWGFWPAQSDIESICLENIEANLYVAKFIGHYAKAKDEMPENITNKSGYLYYTFKRLGLEDNGTYTVSYLPLDSWITNISTAKTYSSLTLLQEASDSMSYTLNASIANGQVFKYVIQVNNGLYTENDTITKIYIDNSALVFNDNCNSLTGFVTIDGWDITTSTYHSATSSITDSPVGDYQENTFSIIDIANSINLTNVDKATLNFWAKWDIEKGFDYVEIQASTNNSTWIPLCGNYTTSGSPNQDLEQPLYDGNQRDWVFETIDLKDYLGQPIYLRFQLVSDNFLNKDGFYFDDLSVTTFSLATNVNKIDKTEAIKCYPNPTNDVLYFDLKNNLFGTITLSNTLGQTVKTINTNGSASTLAIDVKDLANGTYFYELKSIDATLPVPVRGKFTVNK